MNTPESHLARARSFLGAATVLRDNGYLADATSRAYYAIFTAARAALLDRGIEARTHHGVRRAFSDQFVRTGAVEEDLGQWFSRAEQFRTLADYDPDALADPDEVNTLLDQAEAFIAQIENLMS